MSTATTSPRIEGTVVDWNDERGFGFVQPDDGSRQIFVHIRAMPRGADAPKAGERLSFEVELNRDGKPRARYARAVADRSIPRYGKSPWSLVAYMPIVAFAVVYWVATILWHPSPWLLEVYVGTSLVSFALYAIDKSRAVTGRWRVSESALLLLGLFGGWPGAIIAQQVLRHKTRKRSFQAAFAGSIVVNVLAFVLLVSPLVPRIYGFSS